MRRIAAAVLLAVAVLSGCTSDDAADGAAKPFKPFTAADAKFTAAFPDTPERSDQNVPAGTGTLRLVLYTSEVGDELGYSIGWFQLAEPPAAEGMTEFLEATRDGSITAIKGTLVTSASAVHKGLPAMEYVAREPKGHFLKARIVVRGRDVYVAQIISGTQDPPRFGEFVEAFTLTS